MDKEEILLDDDDDIQILDINLNDDKAQVEEPKPVIKKDTVKSNPVKEHLMKQLNCAHNQIDQAKSNIEVIQSVTNKIVQNLASQAAYRDVNSSDSDSDMFYTTGEPVVKRKKNRFYEKRQVLIVGDTWQRIVDDKWVIGVTLQNSTMW